MVPPVGKNDVTLQQVAVRAGVSMATVSRVARGVGPVSDGTRAMVKAVIDELGLRANADFHAASLTLVSGELVVELSVAPPGDGDGGEVGLA